jgi:hypothetical protein
MANPTVSVQLGNPDPLSNPTTLQQLVDTLNPLFIASLIGTFLSPVISSTTPSVGDQDKLWINTDGNGRPLSLRLFYNGNWRKVYTGNTSELKMFTGNPTTHFDNTGLGIVAGEWDGFALCNGQNGTPNLSDSFVIGGRMDNVGISGYNSGWQTNVSGAALKTGGSPNHTIKNSDLPNMTVSVTGRKYDSNGSASVKRAIVTDNWSNTNDFTDPNPIATFGATPPANPQTTISLLPPYYALAFAAFVGYS